MNIWMKLAAGILGGVAIIASLGGFGKKKQETMQENYIAEEEEIPDDILDGVRHDPKPIRRDSNSIRERNERNIRSLQEGLTKASSVLGHISIICNSVVKMFYEDPCIRVTPTTYII